MNHVDLLIKNGQLIDPAQNINSIVDVAISDGKIAAIGAAIKPKKTQQIIDAKDLYLVPGLIDLHTHIYWGATSLSVNANDIYRRSGITTFVDAGSAGAGNFLGLAEYVIKPSPVNIFSFLNISFPGIFAVSPTVNFGEAALLELMSIDDAINVCRQYPELIVGIKARACQRAAKENGLVATQLAIEVAEQTNLPVMAHVGLNPPSITEVIELLRPGDIITHAFREAPNTFVTLDNKIKDCFYQAKEKGIILDIGHGATGFSFRVAKSLAAHNLWPDTISSDLHVLNVNGPAYDLLTTMSKFLCLGMPLEKIIAAVSTTAAKAIDKAQLGTLKVGSPADITLLNIEQGEYSYMDGCQQTLSGRQRFTAVDIIKNGMIL